MAASLDQQVAAVSASLARTRTTLATMDSAFSQEKLRVKDLSSKVSSLSRRADSLTAITEARPVDVRVTSPIDVRDSCLDVAGVMLVPLLTAAVAAFFTMLAAKRGAEEGGRITRVATLEAQQQAAKDEREMRREERLHEREERLAAERRANDKAKYDAGRLTRRYLLLARSQMESLLARAEKGALAPAHVEYVIRTVRDFDEIKARMIALNDDTVEEEIFQWHIVAMDDLAELFDSLTMQSDDYFRKHGVRTVRFARDAALSAAMVNDIGRADRVLAMLRPFLNDA